MMQSLRLSVFQCSNVQQGNLSIAAKIGLQLILLPFKSVKITQFGCSAPQSEKRDLVRKLSQY